MRKVYLFLIIITLYGCDCRLHIEGEVLSNIDEKPIKNATIRLGGTNIITYSDSLGYFNIDYIGGGKAPKPILIISKKGYKNFELEFDNNDSENSIKVKTDVIEFDLKGKKLYPDSMNLSTFMTVLEFDKYSKDYMLRKNRITLFLDPENSKKDFLNRIEEMKKGGWNMERYIIK